MLKRWKVNDPRWKTCEVHSPRERDTEPEKKKRGQETQGGDHLGGLKAGTKQFFWEQVNLFFCSLASAIFWTPKIYLVAYCLQLFAFLLLGNVTYHLVTDDYDMKFKSKEREYLRKVLFRSERKGTHSFHAAILYIWYTTWLQIYLWQVDIELSWHTDIQMARWRQFNGLQPGTVGLGSTGNKQLTRFQKVSCRMKLHH